MTAAAGTKWGQCQRCMHLKEGNAKLGLGKSLRIDP